MNKNAAEVDFCLQQMIMKMRIRHCHKNLPHVHVDYIRIPEVPFLYKL